MSDGESGLVRRVKWMGVWVNITWSVIRDEWKKGMEGGRRDKGEAESKRDWEREGVGKGKGGTRTT